MINLLPPESHKQLQAARHNKVLFGYVIGAGIVFGLILCIYITAFILMKSVENSSQASSAENQRKISAYKNVEAEAKAYTSNLALAKSIFASEISYPTALSKIAGALPAGTVLQSLELSPTTVNTPVTLSVMANSKDSALAVKSSLEKAKVAKNITIANLTEATASTPGNSQPTSGVPGYPVLISLNLTFDNAIFKQPGDAS